MFRTRLRERFKCFENRRLGVSCYDWDRFKNFRIRGFQFWGKIFFEGGVSTSLHEKGDILINELRVASYKLISLRVTFFARVTSYELFLLHELQVTFCVRVTSYCLLHELQVTFYIRAPSCCLIHKLRVTFIARVRVIVYCTSYELLFIARATSYF